MSLRLYFFIALTLCAVYASGQQPEWLNADYRMRTYPPTQFIVAVDSIELGKREKQTAQHRDRLREQLYESVARQVAISVRSQSSQSVDQRMRGGTEEIEIKFSSNTLFGTDVSVSTHLNDFYMPDKSRWFSGIVVVEKQKLANSLNQKSKEALSGLVTRMLVFAEARTPVDLGSIRSEFSKIDRDRRTALHLSPDNDPEFSEYISTYHALLAILESSDQEREFQTDFRRAQNEYKRGHFKSALNSLTVMMRQYPESSEVMELHLNVLTEFESHVAGKVEAHNSQGRFGEALTLINDFLAFAPRNERMLDKRTEVRTMQFNKLATEIEFELTTSNLSRARSKVDQLEAYGDVNPDRYLKLLRMLKELEVSVDKRAVDEKYLSRDYRGAWQDLQRLENRYGRISEFKTIRNKIGRRLYREDAHSVRRGRPRLYSVFAGAELMLDHVAQPTSLSENTPFHFAYSLSFHRKINLREKFTPSGKDVSKADYVGVKARLLDYQSRTSFFAETIDPLSHRNTWNTEFSIDAILARCIHIEPGVRFAEQWAFNDVDRYFLALGLHLPFRRLVFRGDFRFETRFEGSATYQVHAGAFWRFDMIRRFNKQDKQAIRMKYR